jgi:ornithine lipid ester-linked acyl 2-hydroxylase
VTPQVTAAGTPSQGWAIKDIAPLARPESVGRAVHHVVAFAERLNRRQAGLGNRTTITTSDFPWAEELERDERAIRGELDQVLARRQNLPNVQDITTDAASVPRTTAGRSCCRSRTGCARAAAANCVRRRSASCGAFPGCAPRCFDLRASSHRRTAAPVTACCACIWGSRFPSGASGRRSTWNRRCTDREEGRALIFDDAFEHRA